MKVNGWEKPFDILQVISWIVLPLLLFGFYFFCIPFLALTISIPCGLIYGFNFLMVLYTAMKCTSIDPTDNNILRSQSETLHSEVEDDHIYCNVCNAYVHKDSRHCRICDKCVATFDHHCKWLNNCIGEKNYRYFAAVIGFSLTLVSLQLSLSIYLLVKSYTNENHVLDRVGKAYGCEIKDIDGTCLNNNTNFPLEAVISIQILYIILLLPALYLIGQLAIFHIQLARENITTYEWIVRDRKRQLARQREDLMAHHEMTTPRNFRSDGTSSSNFWKRFNRLRNSKSSNQIPISIVPETETIENKTMNNNISGNLSSQSSSSTSKENVQGVLYNRSGEKSFRGFGKQFNRPASSSTSVSTITTTTTTISMSSTNSAQFDSKNMDYDEISTPIGSPKEEKELVYPESNDRIKITVINEERDQDNQEHIRQVVTTYDE